MLLRADKRVSESSERTADRRQRPWYIHNRQEYNIGGTFTQRFHRTEPMLICRLLHSVVGGVAQW